MQNNFYRFGLVVVMWDMHKLITKLIIVYIHKNHFKLIPVHHVRC